MNFASRSKTRSGARKRRQLTTAAAIETCEPRLLLTTPDIVAPTGTVTGDTVEVSWEAVDNAASYEVWITSVESYERIYHQGGFTGTSTSIPVENLSLGRIRIWARATLNDGTNSGWSPSSNAVIRSTPTITGPASTVAGHVTDDASPEITWTSANGASHFEIWVTDLEAKFIADEAAAAASTSTTTVTADPSAYATVYTVDNRLYDADGNLVTNAAGDPVLAEVRSFVLPQTPGDPDSPDQQLNLGRYRIWMRSFDPSFASTPAATPAWGAGYTFQVSARVDNVGPTGPTFQTSPVITWDAVEGATHYDVYVSESGTAGPYFRRTLVSSGDGQQSTQMVLSEAGRPFVDNQDDVVDPSEVVLLESDGSPQLVQIPHVIQENTLLESVISTPSGLAREYTVWVRAIREVTDVPTVFGLWSAPGRFRTVEPPRITGPVGDGGSGVVTSARPVVEWTAIDGAARYEILVHRFNSRPPFLEAQSSDVSYTFTENVPEGTYTIWVRGVDARGRFSDWSDGFTITTSGGAPEITSPTAGQTVTFLNAAWAEVENAVSYEIWVAEIGVDFTAINVSGIVGTTYSHPDPLNNSTYRVWVRALLTDGTFGPWSTAVEFQGGTVQIEETSDDLIPQLASVTVSVLPEASVSVASQSRPVEASPPEDAVPVEVAVQSQPEDSEQVLPAAPTTAADRSATDILTRIAANCVDTEWWEVADESAS